MPPPEDTKKGLLENAAKVQKAAEASLKALLAQKKEFTEIEEAVARMVVSLTKGTKAAKAAQDAMEKSFGPYMVVSKGLQDQLNITAKAYETLNNLQEKNAIITKKQADANKENLKASQAGGTATTPGGAAAPPPPGAAAAAPSPGGGSGGLMGLASIVARHLTGAPPPGGPGGGGGRGVPVIGPIIKALKKGGAKGGRAAGKGIIAGAITKPIALYKTLDQAATGFARLTGHVIGSDQASKQYVARVIEMQHEMSLLGVTQEDIITTSAALAQNSRTWGSALARNTPEAKKLTAELLKLALQAKMVGIDGKDFAATLDIIGKTYRSAKPVEETRKLSAMFVNLGRATGQTVTQVSKNFGSAMEYLSAYSLPKATEIFKKLQITAADSGVSMSALLATAGKFDTFGDAANAVGDLNAMLGGPYLNTLDMVNASEEDRIGMIKDAMAETGKTFDQMDRFEKKAIAKSIGMSVKDARGLFAGEEAKPTAGVESWDKLLGGAQKNAIALNDQLKAVQQSSLMTAKSFKVMDESSREMLKGYAKVIVPPMRKALTSIMEVVFADAAKNFAAAIKKGVQHKDVLKAFSTLMGGMMGDILIRSFEKWQEFREGRKGVATETPLGGKGTKVPGAGGARVPQINMKGEIKAPIIIQIGNEKLEEYIKNIAFKAHNEAITAAAEGGTV